MCVDRIENLKNFINSINVRYIVLSVILSVSIHVFLCHWGKILNSYFIWDDIHITRIWVQCLWFSSNFLIFLFFILFLSSFAESSLFEHQRTIANNKHQYLYETLSIQNILLHVFFFFFSFFSSIFVVVVEINPFYKGFYARKPNREL